jgi:hypothetical protein
MSENKPQKKQASPVSFIIMAVFAFVVGFPIWIVLVLLLMGFLVWRNQKSQKALQQIPLPPAQQGQQQAELDPEQLILAEELAQARREFERLEQLESSAPAAMPETKVAAPERTFARASAFVPAAGTPYGSWGKGRRNNAFAQTLRSKQGLRQAIVSMTVLGQPRALQPHALEPMQQADVAPSRTQ